MIKVYGVNLDGKFRGIVATTSQKKAAELFGISIGHLRTYGSQTWNTEEIEVATKEPEVVWKQSYGSYGNLWIKVA